MGRTSRSRARPVQATTHLERRPVLAIPATCRSRPPSHERQGGRRERCRPRRQPGRGAAGPAGLDGQGVAQRDAQTVAWTRRRSPGPAPAQVLEKRAPPQALPGKDDTQAYALMLGPRGERACRSAGIDLAPLAAPPGSAGAGAGRATRPAATPAHAELHLLQEPGRTSAQPPGPSLPRPSCRARSCEWRTPPAGLLCVGCTCSCHPSCAGTGTSWRAT